MPDGMARRAMVDWRWRDAAANRFATTRQRSAAATAGMLLPGRRGSRVLNGKKIVVVMPAYNAARTLRRTSDEVPREVVDEIVLVDDYSSDETVRMARELGLTTFHHKQNLGYGRNQKTCYREALRRAADVVVMLHPDYQYSPRLIVPMAGMIAYGEYDLVLGSRIIGGGALKGGMPLYKYVSNRFLTAIQNLLLGQKLSEYHTGYRAFRRDVLETLPLDQNSDDFVFDNEMLAQAMHFGYRIGEVSCPTRYFPEASSINFRRSVSYGLGVLNTSLKFRLQKMGLRDFALFRRQAPQPADEYYELMPAAKQVA
jgi:glycosyltransferase involved in cell wall biosynthesis